MMENEFVSEDTTGLQSELVRELEGEGNLSVDVALSQPLMKADLQTPTARIRLEKIERPPGRFDLLTNSLVYRWQTTASLARKVTGPMREWATELKYRTGVHIEVEPTFPERAAAPEAEGGYATADEVELTVYLFGSERGIFNCRQLMEAALDQDPAYVRLGVFRRKPAKASGAAANTSSSGGGDITAFNPNEDIEWLMLRRINRDLRPPDIPPISLKLPGKWTLLFEHFKEAAVRTLWEETGITVDPNNVFPTARLHQVDPLYYWRVPVHYFVAEVPFDVEVLGPQVGLNTYVHHWDSQLLRQSPDPIDRAWAQLANPETGCAWMKVPMIDELQRPLRGEDYMATRYTPPPYSGLNSVLGFAVPASTEDGGAAAGAAAESEETTPTETGKAVANDDTPPAATPQLGPTLNA
jgi:8-oxo-dGTP pyrophosphatase MutT (NUDIX family)